MHSCTEHAPGATPWVGAANTDLKKNWPAGGTVYSVREMRKQVMIAICEVPQWLALRTQETKDLPLLRGGDI